MMTSSVKKRTIGSLVKGAKNRKLPHSDRMIRRLLPTYHFYIVVKGAKWRIPESDRWWYRYLTTFAHLSQLTLPIIAEPAIQWITFHAMVHLQFTMHRPFTNHWSFTIHAFSSGAGASFSIYKDSYLIFVIFFTLVKFLENKIYTEKRQFFALNL